MPKLKRQRRERTDDWPLVKQYTLWPEQEAYELIRPIVLYGETAGERSRETGANERTLDRKADRFVASGMASLFPDAALRSSDEDRRELPPPIRQAIGDLKAEFPAFRPHEIATICFARFGRQPSHHTVQQVLAAGPPPSITGRRYLPYSQMPDQVERRLAIVRLHVVGRNTTSIAAYLQTTRRLVHETLQRWVDEGVKGLEHKSHAPKHPARKVTLEAINEVRKRQENPLLGEYRMHTALKQLGFDLSPATCGRIMQMNRRLYGLDSPARTPKPKKAMPFKAQFRHEFWSIDVRYIEKHRLSDINRPVYVISVLENYSRAVLASSISRTQDTYAYLQVLRSALKRHGIPKAIVTDGGAIFTAQQAIQVYRFLGIRKERIEAGQPWQNYIESMFSVQRRMVDYKFEQAETWADLLRAHEQWVQDYNYQDHFAHEKRQDGRHSQAAVLGWVQGTLYPEQVLDRVFYATQFTRQLDQSGYIRFRRWRFYGERGLARKEVAVWVYQSMLQVEYQAVELSKYGIVLEEDRKRIRAVKHARIVETHFQSPQLSLFGLGPDEWVRFLRLPAAAPRKRPRQVTAIQPQLFDAPQAEPG
jgi:transposase